MQEDRALPTSPSTTRRQHRNLRAVQQCQAARRKIAAWHGEQARALTGAWPSLHSCLELLNANYEDAAVALMHSVLGAENARAELTKTRHNATKLADLFVACSARRSAQLASMLALNDIFRFVDDKFGVLDRMLASPGACFPEFVRRLISDHRHDIPQLHAMEYDQFTRWKVNFQRAVLEHCSERARSMRDAQSFARNCAFFDMLAPVEQRDLLFLLDKTPRVDVACFRANMRQRMSRSSSSSSNDAAASDVQRLNSFELAELLASRMRNVSERAFTSHLRMALHALPSTRELRSLGTQLTVPFRQSTASRAA